MGSIARLEQTAGSTPQVASAAGLILMYHRVGEVEPDPWGLSVSPLHFAEHLEVLRKHGHALPLGRAVQALRNGRIASGTLVVTFDDGYADNLHIAKPLLELYDVPATVFLASDYIGTPREFWWDALDWILLGPQVLPPNLCMVASGKTSEWVLGEARYYGDEARRSDRRRLTRVQGVPSGRYQFYRAVHRELQFLHDDERRSVMDNLKNWAGVTLGIRDSHRCLSPDEALALAEGELIDVGAHTVTHPVLATLPQALQRVEIRQSKLDLEHLLDRPVTNFAYPYGHCTAETAAVVRDEGFSSACSAETGLLTDQSDVFCLPRIKAQDWDGEALARILSNCFRS